MNLNPLVSVIIPVHNGASYLKETLDSVYQQDYKNMEIIAVNHGSTDFSERILSKDSRVRLINQEHLGNANARNTGIRNAKGDYLAFIDQDDLWEPAKVRKQMQYLLENPEVLYTISHFQSFLSPGSSLPSWVRLETFLKGKPDYSPSSLVVRKTVFEINGLFKEGLKIASDVDWFFQANERSLKIGIIPEVLHKRRVHNGNQSHFAAAWKKEMLQVIRSSVARKKS